MRYISAAFLTLLFALVPLFASASCTIVQTCSASSGTTCVFGTSPSNGDVAVITCVKSGTGGAVDCGSNDVTDSNSASLTAYISIGSSSLPGVGVWAYTVSGSPSGTYSFANSGFTEAVGFDVSGVSATPIAASASSTSAPSVTSSPAISVSSGDVQIALGSTTGAAASVTCSNGSFMVESSASGYEIGYCDATASASSTAEMSNSGSHALGVGLLDLPCATAASSSFSDLGQVSYVPPQRYLGLTW